MATVHPSALKQDWSLRYGPPLKSPKASERTYLSFSPVRSQWGCPGVSHGVLRS